MFFYGTGYETYSRIWSCVPEPSDSDFEAWWENETLLQENNLKIQSPSLVDETAANKTTLHVALLNDWNSYLSLVQKQIFL